MIFDCFPFFNELDALEIRLGELYETVDRFVLVEATQTHSGHAKPLFFADNRSRFAPWLDKVTHLIVDDMPTTRNPWVRETFQRNAILRALTGLNPLDTVVISDLDEIASPSALSRWDPSMGPRSLDQMFFYYWLNCLGGSWNRGKIIAGSDLLLTKSPTLIRHLDCPLLSQGGWHFSFLGNKEAVAKKLDAFAHQELNIPDLKNPLYLDIVRSLGIDLFGHFDHQRTFCDISEQFPGYIRENMGRFSHLICSARFNERWVSDEQILRLTSFLSRTHDLPGAILELGCWEGRSTVALAIACYPAQVVAIDSWHDSINEAFNDVAVGMGKDRDIYDQFLNNIRAVTAGNVQPHRSDIDSFLERWSGPIRFVHIDASHDYESVRRKIQACVKWIVPGGVICGDKFQSANCAWSKIGDWAEGAAQELLPGCQSVGGFWIWSNASGRV